MKLLKGDFLIIALVLAFAVSIALYFLLPKGTENIALITQDGKILKQLDLTTAQDETFVLDVNGHYKLEILNKKLRIVEADCPDKVCVATGYIGKAGQIIVCLPNKLAIEIKGQKKEVDVVVN
jgi:hypothetical protein